jgi:hypothetical protein
VSDYGLSIIATLELEWREATMEAERDKVMEFTNLLGFGSMYGLQGKEVENITGFLKSLEVSREHLECAHLVVHLLGPPKGGMDKRYHMMILVREMVSCLEP